MSSRSLVLFGAVAVLATSISAQSTYSDGFQFLKAVDERDAATIVRLVAVPGSTVVNAKDRSNGEGALHKAVRARDLTWLAFFLGKGARPDLQSGRGDTPLFLAAQIGWYEGAQQLLARKALVDLPNSRGETPLLAATQRRDVAMVKLLLSARADPNRKDFVAGMSALDYARTDPQAATIVALLQRPH